MIRKNLEIVNKLGLHARAAAKVVSVASRYSASIHILHHDQEVDAKSIMGLLTLGAGQGASLEVIVEGDDEEQAMQELSALFARRFDEGE